VTFYQHAIYSLMKLVTLSFRNSAVEVFDIHEFLKVSYEAIYLPNYLVYQSNYCMVLLILLRTKVINTYFMFRLFLDVTKIFKEEQLCGYLKRGSIKYGLNTLIRTVLLGLYFVQM